MDLDILPIRPPDDKGKKKKELHPNLPDVWDSGRLGVMVGCVKSGKSTLISNLLLREEFYKGCFDIVYIISNTIFNDTSSRYLLEQYHDTCFSEYSDDLIDRILKYQETFPKDKRPNVAVILDDFVGINQNSKIFHLATRYRHYGIRLLMFASQVFRCLPTPVRANASFVLISRNPNEKEIEKMSEEYGSLCGGDKKFRELYHEATKDDYSWMYIDLASNPTKVYKNFNTLIYTGDR
jgi:hypothetical protein